MYFESRYDRARMEKSERMRACGNAHDNLASSQLSLKHAIQRSDQMQQISGILEESYFPPAPGLNYFNCETDCLS